MLSHIVYVSARKQNCTEEEIQKILASCKNNNATVDITGVLLYSDTHFIQYLEGDYKQIIGLYDKIKLDPRHKNAVLVSSGQMRERSFPSWQMGAKKIDSNSINFITDVTPSDKLVFQSILTGKNQEAGKAQVLLKKFFK